jgi:outer membrane protein W
VKRLAAVLAVACVAAGSAAFAQQGDFGVRVGYQRLADGDSGALVGGGFFRWDWHRIVMLEATVLYHVEEVNDTTDLELWPVQFSGLIYPLRRDYAISPYLLAGGGLYITRLVEKHVDTESEFDFGWHLGFGFDFALSDRVFLEADFRYLWVESNSDAETAADVLSDFDSWMATAGIGFRL